MKKAIIIGASSGIDKELAVTLLEHPAEQPHLLHQLKNTVETTINQWKSLYSSLP